MQKWYAPCRLLLAAALSTQLVGCASTSRTVGRWMGRDQVEAPQLADADSKPERKTSKQAIGAASADKTDKSVKTAKADVKDKADAGAPRTDRTKSETAVADSRPDRPKAGVVTDDVKKADGKSTAKTDVPALTGKDKPVTDVAQSKLAAKRPAADDSDDPFASFPVDQVKKVDQVAKVDPTAPLAEPPKNTLAEALGLTPAPAQDSAVKTASLSTEPAADPVYDDLMAAVEKTRQQDLKGEETRLGLQSDLPAWAMDDIPSNKSSSSIPAIQQTAATSVQSAFPTMDDSRLSAAPVAQPAVEPTSATAENQAPALPLDSGKTVEGATTAESAKKPSLIALCPDAAGEVRDLVMSLDSGDVETLKRSIHRLGRMQSQATAAQPALRAMLKHPNGFVQVHAALALVRMQQTDREVSQTLIVALRSKDASVRSFAAAVLVEMGPESANALPALTAGLSDQDAYVRLHVAEVLIRHADWSYAALQAINNSLLNTDENVRWLATYSLAELAPQSQDSVDALGNALHDPVDKVKVGAAYALGEIGPMAKSALPELEKCKSGNNQELKSAAEYAISQIQQ